ncbi:MAG TPA: hypothetical protein VMV41_05230 [Cellulomonadaceae bacterium]|nr:hypothetical protein [Cellulomonadaceae bacterium]
MPDRLLARCGRNVEDEPGFRSSELFDGNVAQLIRSTTNVVGATTYDTDMPTAYFEPFSRRWMGAPNAPAGTDIDTDYNVLAGGVGLLAITPFGNAGVALDTEGAPDALWSVERVSDFALGRGWQLDLYPYAPEDYDADRIATIRVEWGNKWRLELTGNEQAPGLARLYENGLAGTGSYATWRLREIFPLIDGPFYDPGELHRFWFQPLADDEMLIRNLTNDSLGAVVITKAPYSYDPDEERGDELDLVDGKVGLPWGPDPLRISGLPRIFWVFRYVEFPTDWHVETDGTRDIGFDCAQLVTNTLSEWHPDGVQDNDTSDYQAELTVYVGEPAASDEWNDVVGPAPNEQRNYSWRMSVTGPGDGSLAEYSDRAIVIDDCRLTWPITTGADGLTGVNLFAQAGVQVLSVEEDRGEEDWDASLSVRLRCKWETYQATLRPLFRPYTRWQWVLDTDDLGTYYVRFDGLAEKPQVARWCTAAGDYMADVRVICRTRWMQVDDVVFRCMTPLDGMDRSDIYSLLAELIPLDIATEFECDPLTDDGPAPEARRGERPAWMPRIGARLGDVFRDVNQYLGPDDRLLFEDRTGVMVLHVSQPTGISLATFYRDTATAALNGVPAQVIMDTPGSNPLTDEEDATEFYNEIVVVGQNKDNKRQLYAAHYAYPPSWQDSADDRYVGVRRSLVVVKPELNTQGDVNRAAWALFEAYGAFRGSARMESHLVPALYPGDVITIDAGTEPGAVDTEYRIVGMRTESQTFSADVTRRWTTSYDLAEVV